MSPPPPESRRIVHVDAPQAVGAAWVRDRAPSGAREAPTRRPVTNGFVVGSLLLVPVVGAIGVGVAMYAASGAVTLRDRPDLQHRQETEGWAVGAPPGALLETSDCPVPPVPAAALNGLAADLAPSSPAWAAYNRGTLLSAATHAPPAESGIRPLAEALRPHCTLDMRVAHARGRALADALAGAPATVALVVDLPGPEAVALAAALADTYEPVWTFETWPHPKGAVPAHLTLGSVLYWRTDLQASATRRTPGRPPVFVLDSARITSSFPEFDNGYGADLPTGEVLRAAGIDRLLYVRGRSSDGASADLARPLGVLHWTDAIPVQLVALQDFHTLEVPERPADPSEMTWYWGGSPETHRYFPAAYGLAAAGAGATPPPPVGVPWIPEKPGPAAATPPVQRRGG